jgi:thiol:disulfide interchange protein DsbD
MKLLLASCVCLLVFVCECARSVPQQQAHSKASLIIEQSAAAPGSQVNVGIQFVTDTGWHIYWQNPGDSGEPPRVQWQLPAGISAGALQWPTPTRLNTPAGSDFGYQGTTTLLSSLQIPMTAQTGTVDVRGDLRWLVCHDICVPQQTQLAASIQISNAVRVNDSARHALDSAAGQIPKPLPAGMQAVATNLPESFRLSLDSGEPITSAQFFPADPAQIDNGTPQELTSHGRIVSLVLKKSEYLQQEPRHLRGVIILNGRNAFQLDTPVQSSYSSKRSSNK